MYVKQQVTHVTGKQQAKDYPKNVVTEKEAQRRK